MLLARFACTALALGLTACRMIDEVPASYAGDVRVSVGGSYQEMQSFADVEMTATAVDLSYGHFISPHWMAEGVLGYAFSLEDDDDPLTADLETSAITLAGGLRYYFDNEASVRPYAGFLLGIRRMEVEFGPDDRDTPFLVSGRVGVESFITDSVALDVGVAAQQVLDAELLGVEDDLTSVGLVIGLSAWL